MRVSSSRYELFDIMKTGNEKAPNGLSEVAAAMCESRIACYNSLTLQLLEQMYLVFSIASTGGK